MGSPLSAHMNQQTKRGVKIVACEPEKRLIEGETQNGEVISINAYSFNPAFRWPKTGEHWMVREENASWFLESIWEGSGIQTERQSNPKPGALEQLIEITGDLGQIVIHGEYIYWYRSEGENHERGIGRAKIDGTERRLGWLTEVEAGNGFVVTDAFIYFIEGGSNAEIWRVKNESAKKVIPELIYKEALHDYSFNTSGLAVDVSGRYLYILTEGPGFKSYIARYDLVKEEINLNWIVIESINVAFNPGLVCNSEYLYWLYNVNGQIGRVKIDGMEIIEKWASFQVPDEITNIAVNEKYLYVVQYKASHEVPGSGATWVTRIECKSDVPVIENHWAELYRTNLWNNSSEGNYENNETGECRFIAVNEDELFTGTDIGPVFSLYRMLLEEEIKVEPGDHVLSASSGRLLMNVEGKIHQIWPPLEKTNTPHRPTLRNS